MKRRVLIIYTGGTIGMQPSEQGYVPMSGFNELVSTELNSRGINGLPDFEFDMIECQQLIDSSNLVPDDWTRLGNRLKQNWNDYDGFVVLHGTDTMAYTASMLSFMLQGMDKPVILTGSQIPMVELRSDAPDNLTTALLLAGNYDISEVCIYFNGRLLRGNRSSKVKSSGFDAFNSPNFPWLASVGINIELQQSLLLEQTGSMGEIPVFDPDAVSILQTYPGISARIVEAVLDHESLKGLVLQTYGAGNPPDANPAFIDCLQRASERGVAILNITQCPHGSVSQGAYATGATLNRIGVVPGGDMTLEAAFTKMHYLISQSRSAEEIRTALRTPLCGELNG